MFVVFFLFQDCTIRSCDFDTEQTLVLHSPEKRSERISADTEVHLALTPLQPVVFFGFHKRMSVTGSTFVLQYPVLLSFGDAYWLAKLFGLHEVVGTVEGGRPPTKIKTDLKKPVVNLACHPRLPVLVSIIYCNNLIVIFNWLLSLSYLSNLCSVGLVIYSFSL